MESEYNDIEISPTCEDFKPEEINTIDANESHEEMPAYEEYPNPRNQKIHKVVTTVTYAAIVALAATMGLTLFTGATATTAVINSITLESGPSEVYFIAEIGSLAENSDLKAKLKNNFVNLEVDYDAETQDENLFQGVFEGLKSGITYTFTLYDGTTLLKKESIETMYEAGAL